MSCMLLAVITHTLARGSKVLCSHRQLYKLRLRMQSRFGGFFRQWWFAAWWARSAGTSLTESTNREACQRGCLAPFAPQKSRVCVSASGCSCCKSGLRFRAMRFGYASQQRSLRLLGTRLVRHVRWLLSLRCGVCSWQCIHRHAGSRCRDDAACDLPLGWRIASRGVRCGLRARGPWRSAVQAATSSTIVTRRDVRSLRSAGGVSIAVLRGAAAKAAGVTITGGRGWRGRCCARAGAIDRAQVGLQALHGQCIGRKESHEMRAPPPPNENERRAPADEQWCWLVEVVDHRNGQTVCSGGRRPPDFVRGSCAAGVVCVVREPFSARLRRRPGGCWDSAGEVPGFAIDSLAMAHPVTEERFRECQSRAPLTSTATLAEIVHGGAKLRDTGAKARISCSEGCRPCGYVSVRRECVFVLTEVLRCGLERVCKARDRRCFACDGCVQRARSESGQHAAVAPCEEAFTGWWVCSTHRCARRRCRLIAAGRGDWGWQDLHPRVRGTNGCACRCVCTSAGGGCRYRSGALHRRKHGHGRCQWKYSGGVRGSSWRCARSSKRHASRRARWCGCRGRCARRRWCRWWSCSHAVR